MVVIGRCLVSRVIRLTNTSVKAKCKEEEEDDEKKWRKSSKWETAIADGC